MAISALIILATVAIGFPRVLVPEAMASPEGNALEDGGGSEFTVSALEAAGGISMGAVERKSHKTTETTSAFEFSDYLLNGFTAKDFPFTQTVIGNNIPSKSNWNRSNLVDETPVKQTSVHQPLRTLDASTTPFRKHSIYDTTVHDFETTSIKYERRTCHKEKSCLGHCFDESKDWFCRCDVECLLFGDCCFDFFPICLNLSSTEMYELVGVTSSDEALSSVSSTKSSIVADNNLILPKCKKPIPETLNRSIALDWMEVSGCLECSAVETSSVARYTSGYLMVHVCPDTWTNSELRNQCENQTTVRFDNPPVYDKVHTALSYRNVYCALCHGRSYEDLEPWSLELSCPKRENLGELIKDRSYVHDCCKASFGQITNGKYRSRHCHISIITDEDKAGLTTWRSKCLKEKHGAETETNSTGSNVESPHLSDNQTSVKHDPGSSQSIGGLGLGFFGAFQEPKDELHSDNVGSEMDVKQIAPARDATDPTAETHTEQLSTSLQYQTESVLSRWCQFYNTLSLNLTLRKSGCTCPVYILGDVGSYADTGIVMVPLSALFTLDPKFGVETKYVLQDVKNPTNDVSTNLCESGEFFISSTEQCIPFVQDRTFQPEGIYSAIASLEITATVYDKFPASAAVDSNIILDFFRCFVFANGLLRDAIVSGFKTEWEFSTDRKVHSDGLAAVKQYFDLSPGVHKVEHNSSSSTPTCSDISQPVFKKYLDVNNSNTERWFQREYVALLLFKSQEFGELNSLFILLRKAVYLLFLDETTNSILVFNSIIMRNFNHSTESTCLGEIKVFNVSDRAVDSSGIYWLDVDQIKDKVDYTDGIITDYFTFRANGQHKHKSEGMVCQPPRSVNCSSWLTVPHNPQTVTGIGVVLNIRGHLYKITDFFDTGEMLLVCNDTLVEVAKSESTKFNQLEVILNYVAFVMSLLGLFLTFTTYCVFRVLRNVPGMLVMSLSAFMFAAILMWVVGAGRVTDEFVCSIMAAVLHFLWLSTFLWINTLAVDVSRAFSSDGTMNTLSNRGKKKRYLVYMAYVIGASMLVVGGTILTGFLENPESAFNGVYGENQFCFVRPDIAVYVFYCPVGCTLFINLCLFVKSVRAIRVVSKLSKQAKLRVDHQWNVFLFAKLSLVLGLSWLLFFLLGHLDNPVVRMFCGTVNSLQGVFVFAVFVCSRRVMRLYAKICNREKKTVDSEPTAVTQDNNRTQKQSKTTQ